MFSENGRIFSNLVTSIEESKEKYKYDYALIIGYSKQTADKFLSTLKVYIELQNRKLNNN